MKLKGEPTESPHLSKARNVTVWSYGELLAQPMFVREKPSTETPTTYPGRDGTTAPRSSANWTAVV